MFIFAPIAAPFIYLFKYIAAVFLFLSNVLFSAYSAVLGWSMKLNDLTESNIWPRE
jgi:hypothetical protein